MILYNQKGIFTLL